MDQYLDHMRDIIEFGTKKEDRTGTGTLSIFGHQMRFDLREGFPLVTTKKCHLKSIIHELLWFLDGQTNIGYLNDNGVKIWDEWRKPYSLNRDLVFVDPIEKPYESYSGNYSYAGLDTKPNSVERKLAEQWVRMMKRCYLESYENYRFYGACDTSVCARWHDPANFIEDAKKLPHWDYKLDAWGDFELDKDYYGSNQYGPDTCVWLSSGENNMYTKSAKPVKVTTANGFETAFVGLNEAARRMNMPNSTLYRFLKDGLPTVLKGNNKKYLGWEFDELSVEGKLPRLKLIDQGELGPVYGKQWRSWGSGKESIDQIQEAVRLLRYEPDSRRIIVSAWNVADIPDMALAPCHTLFQFYSEEIPLETRLEMALDTLSDDDLEEMRCVPEAAIAAFLEQHEIPKRYLSCQLYQRSADWFLGVPFNIASYALLTMMMAQVVNMVPKDFVHSFGDTHLYLNHLDQAKEQMYREPKELPVMTIKNRGQSINDFQFDDFELSEYHPHPHIAAPVAV